MKYLLTIGLFVGGLTLASCEGETCYECEGFLGLENDCCGDKDKCETFRKDCDFNGGKIVTK